MKKKQQTINQINKKTNISQSDDTLVETIDGISNSYFNKELDKSITTNTPTTDE